MAALAWLRRSLPVIVAGSAFAVVAGVTGRVSYLHIEALSLALHQSPDIARIMPFGVDGLIVVGSVALLQAPAGQEWLGWVCVGPGTAASLFANVESGLRYGPVSAGWAGMATVGFFVATFVFERWLKGQAKTAARTVPGVPPLQGPAPVPVEPGGAGEPAPVPAAPLAKEAALLALIGTGTQREIAALLGVSKTTVGRWKDRLTQGGTLDPELSRDVPDPEEAAVPPEARYALNGTAAGG